MSWVRCIVTLLFAAAVPTSDAQQRTFLVPRGHDVLFVDCADCADGDAVLDVPVGSEAAYSSTFELSWDDLEEVGVACRSSKTCRHSSLTPHLRPTPVL